ncbi:MAG: exodeoxyribonuclease VII small subunit [Candidatus Uhrbacteria bacterium]|nr:exodeoxyribonuclease VII small subunit [Candidatus Uhrbacteria bacterium]
MAKKTAFSDQFAELEEITEWFETADVDLDEGLKKFERGLELAKALKQKLADVENTVVTLKKKFAALEENEGTQESTNDTNS